MAYEVTATRKRPQGFEKLVGQEFVVSTIENAIKSGRIAHAYLFSGPRGVGKTSSARLLAKALNCQLGPSAQPCLICEQCKEITQGASTDVIEIDGASNTSVNDIRVIKEEVMFPPQGSRYKIYIIDEVHMLSTSAFNALLKTIEEPPEYIIFIFATTEIQKVPATIRSRCQQFQFQLISLDNIKECLKEAASEMSIKMDDDALFFIAKEAHGSMRDAYTLFDQIAAFSQDHITLDKIKNKLGLVGSEQINTIISFAIFNQTKKALEEISKAISKGISIEQLIKDMSLYFRAMLFIKSGITSEELLNIRAEEISKDLLAILTVSQIEAAINYLLQLYRDIRYSLDSRYELELFISRLSSLTKLSTSAELVDKLNSLKEDIMQGKTTIIKERAEIKIQTNIAVPFVAEEEIKEEKNESLEEKDVVVVEKKKDISDFDFRLMAEEIDEVVFGFKDTLKSIIKYETKENEIVLYVDSSLRQTILDNDKQTIKKYLEDRYDYTAKITVLVIEKEERKASKALEKVNKIFRGQIKFIEEKR